MEQLRSVGIPLGLELSATIVVNCALRLLSASASTVCATYSLIVKDDDRDIVKILDFGVAKSALQGIDGSNTKTGAMLGTPYYMSPEQAQGIKTVDSRSDLWSLAVIVFQCLTGRLPFESEALGDLLVRIIVAPIPTPSQLNPRIPAGFDAWWGKAADRDPDGRYQTAKEFAEKLSVALGTSSVTDVAERSRLYRGSEQPAAWVPSSMSPQTSGPIRTPIGAQTAAMGTPNPIFTPASAPSLTQLGVQGSLHSTTGNLVPATFSSSGAHGMPKKGASAWLLLGGLLALVGLALGGVALTRGQRSVAAASGDTTGSSSVVASGPSPAIKAVAALVSAEPQSQPRAPGSATEILPIPASSAAIALDGVSGSAHRPSVTAPKTTALFPGTKAPTPSVQPATSSPAVSVKPAVKEKPINLGF